MFRASSLETRESPSARCLAFSVPLAFSALAKGVALGQGGQLGVQVGHVFVGRVAAVAHGLPVGFALGIRQENGRDTLNGIFFTEYLVLLAVQGTQ